MEHMIEVVDTHNQRHLIRASSILRIFESKNRMTMLVLSENDQDGSSTWLTTIHDYDSMTQRLGKICLVRYNVTKNAKAD